MITHISSRGSSFWENKKWYGHKFSYNAIKLNLFYIKPNAELTNKLKNDLHHHSKFIYSLCVFCVLLMTKQKLIFNIKNDENTFSLCFATTKQFKFLFLDETEVCWWNSRALNVFKFKCILIDILLQKRRNQSIKILLTTDTKTSSLPSRSCRGSNVISSSESSLEWRVFWKYLKKLKYNTNDIAVDVKAIDNS